MESIENTCKTSKLPRNISFLSGNVLKLLAVAFMTFDHVGFYMFPPYRYPDLLWLRYVGRLAFPIFCFMIAEGAFYTKHPKKHFSLIAGLALLMQAVLYFALEELDFTIFVIFTFSILLIRLFDFSFFFAKQAKASDKTVFYSVISTLFALLFLALLAALYYACFETKKLAAHFDANYGFLGIVTPFVLYAFKKYVPLCKNRIFEKIGMLSLLASSLVLLWKIGGPEYQWMALLALPLLALYNGKRGKWKLKYFFYLYYPLHMVVIAGIAMLLGM